MTVLNLCQYVILAFLAWDTKVSTRTILLKLQDLHDCWSIFSMAAAANTHKKAIKTYISTLYMK